MKAGMLLSNSHRRLAFVSDLSRIPERIIGVVLLGTGAYLFAHLPMKNSFILIKLVCVFAAIPLSIIAFKKKIKMLIFFSFGLFAAAVGLTEISKKKVAAGELGNISQVAATNGEEIYKASCAQCHGADGKLGIMNATDLASARLEETRIMSTIKDGKGMMVGYQGVLSDEQMKAVTEYVRKLRD